MQDDKQAKQQYLRQEILEKEYNPEEFIIFLNSKIKIGDNLDLCQLQELKNIVQQFIAIKESQQNKQNSQIISDSHQLQPTQSIIIQGQQQPQEKPQIQKSKTKPKQVLLKKVNPVIVQNETSQAYKCIKIVDKFQKYRGTIRCQVHSPQRKETGGFFGIGATSFLQFKVSTQVLGWQVGRRYSDFVWLRNYLLKKYPTYVIPPIPQKKASKRTQRHVQKRMRILSFFLNDLVAVPVFMNNPIVQGFLQEKQLNGFQKIKKEGDETKLTQSISMLENQEGVTQAKLTQQNKVYLDEMEKLAPLTEKKYKQITRCGKNLQNLYTQQVNTLYQMGNHFATLHQEIRGILNKIPLTDGLRKINQMYITLNNMTIEWGNIIRNQNDFIEKNFNTFFKYLRNQVHGFFQVHQKESQIELEYSKAKIALQKKKQKIYALYDPNRWQLKSKELAQLPKQYIHDKQKAFSTMLPKQTAEIEEIRMKLFFKIDQHYINGNKNQLRCVQKFCENFQQFTIKIKVNNQQLSQLWNEMSNSFTNSDKKERFLKDVPIYQDKGDQIMDD